MLAFQVMKKTDKAAKSALNKPILRIPVPYTDRKPIISKYIHDKRQQTWHYKHKINYQIYPTIPPYPTLSSSYQQKDQVLYN